MEAAGIEAAAGRGLRDPYGYPQVGRRLSNLFNDSSKAAHSRERALAILQRHVRHRDGHRDPEVYHSDAASQLRRRA